LTGCSCSEVVISKGLTVLSVNSVKSNLLSHALPPPFCWQRYGNLQMFPSPTQNPRIVRKNWVGLSHCWRSCKTKSKKRSKSFFLRLIHIKCKIFLFSFNPNKMLNLFLSFNPNKMSLSFYPFIFVPFEDKKSCIRFRTAQLKKSKSDPLSLKVKYIFKNNWILAITPCYLQTDRKKLF
jgi:hypothetical protein